MYQLTSVKIFNKAFFLFCFSSCYFNQRSCRIVSRVKSRDLHNLQVLRFVFCVRYPPLDGDIYDCLQRVYIVPVGSLVLFPSSCSDARAIMRRPHICQDFFSPAIRISIPQFLPQASAKKDPSCINCGIKTRLI